MNRSFDRITFNNNFPLGTSAETVPLSIGQYQSFGVYATCTYVGLEDSAGTMVLEISDDKASWAPIASSAQAFSSAITYLSWTRDFNPFKFIRVSITNVSGTGGTADIYLEGLNIEGA
jgi:hypothetical protein